MSNVEYTILNVAVVWVLVAVLEILLVNFYCIQPKNRAFKPCPLMNLIEDNNQDHRLDSQDKILTIIAYVFNCWPLFPLWFIAWCLYNYCKLLTDTWVKLQINDSIKVANSTEPKLPPEEKFNLNSQIQVSSNVEENNNIIYVDDDNLIEENKMIAINNNDITMESAKISSSSQPLQEDNYTNGDNDGK